ncbi:MAG: hypothetical protein REH83_02015 [Rickettsiella sp.]|nr:hypothetical protein [Rickettsiella sp.]
MTWLKIIAVIVSIALASLAYILLIRYFPSEQLSFLSSKSLTRALLVDLKIKSNQDFPTFLPENSGYLVMHLDDASADHRKDILETRDIFDFLIKTNKNTVETSDTLYSEMEVMFLKKTLIGLRANYVALASLGIKSVFFDPDYLSQFSELYEDKLPHAAGYIIMTDGSQRLIRDILVK